MHLLFVDLGRVGTEVRVDVESSCSSLGRIVRIAWCVEQGRSVGQLQTSPSTSMEVYVKRVKLWRDAREYRARKEYAKENQHDTVNSFEYAVYLFYTILRSSLPYFHDASGGNVRASAIFFLSRQKILFFLFYNIPQLDLCPSDKFRQSIGQPSKCSNCIWLIVAG